MATKNHKTIGPINTEKKGDQTFWMRYVVDGLKDLPLYMVRSFTMAPIKIPLSVDNVFNVFLEKELDVGAPIIIISQAKYKEHFQQPNIKRVIYTP